MHQGLRTTREILHEAVCVSERCGYTACMQEDAPFVLLALAARAQAIKDFRRDLGKRYPLWYLIVLAVVAVVGGADSWLGIAAFWQQRHALRKRLFSPEESEYGIPAHDTFRRVFMLLPEATIQSCMEGWLSDLQAAGVLKLEAGEVLAADGKVLRGSHDERRGRRALSMVSVYATQAGVVLSQAAVEQGENEIRVLPEVLARVNLKGHIVVTDAAHAQRSNAEQIVAAGGEYVFALKGNHGRMFEALQETWRRESAEGFRHTKHHVLRVETRGHGREEIREHWLVNDPEYVHYFTQEIEVWPRLGAVGFVRRIRHTRRGMQEQLSFFVTSLSGSVERFARAVREYWRIENSAHWVLDVVLKEDGSRVRSGHEAEHFGALRRVAMNILRLSQRHDPKGAPSLNIRRQRAAWSDEYLLFVLTSAANENRKSDGA